MKQQHAGAQGTKPGIFLCQIYYVPKLACIVGGAYALIQNVPAKRSELCVFLESACNSIGRINISRPAQRKRQAQCRIRFWTPAETCPEPGDGCASIVLLEAQPADGGYGTGVFPGKRLLAYCIGGMIGGLPHFSVQRVIKPFGVKTVMEVLIDF